VPRFLTTGAVCLALAACATGADKPAVCDGRHRRPANPNGSVLLGEPRAQAPAATPAPSAKPMRSAAVPASYRPCGARA
jgi:hypothetical protein